MRCATNGLYPVIAVWENVMGAFSSNDRMDFRAVLQSFSDTEISMPPTGGWANAGMVRGERLTCAGGSWMPSIGESPDLFSEERESSLWQILEDSVPQKYYLSPVICSRFLRLAQTTGPPPEPVEYLLIKQGENTRHPPLSGTAYTECCKIRKPFCFPRKFRTAR